MWVIPSNRVSTGLFEPHEALFLDCWYGFTHDRSLDSHRVRCLNARTILRELCDELEKGRLDEPEFCGICEEAVSLLQNDPIVASEFTKSYASISPLLKDLPALRGSSQKRDKSDNETKLRNLRFATADLAAALDARYFPTLCVKLRQATEQKESDPIEPLTRATLSDLVARGWTLRELFKWHEKFLANDGRSFTENLDFMLRLLNRPTGGFSVTLRVSGGSTIRRVATFGSFTLSTDVAHPVDKPHEKRFAASDEYTTFAERDFESVDFVSAAIVARDELEPLLDALRFEYEPRLLEIDKRCLVVRRSDNRRILVHVTNPVPNPVESLDEHGFEAFTKRLAATLNSGTLTSESKTRIETGLRRYRFGRDSHSYADKFLNWWMGLEALANVGGIRTDGKKQTIGRTVSENVSHAMLTGYLVRILRDFVATLKYLKPPWQASYEPVTGSKSFAELDVPGLVRLLQDDVQTSTLWSTLADRPFVVRRGQAIVDWLADPKKTAEHLTTHRKHLQWHINRLYRIRCCLVHGSPVRFRLLLFSANLEYYLKQTLSFTLDALAEHSHVADLASLFQRGVIRWERQLKALNDSNANRATTADAIFASVIVND